jgi:hypothetical protein
MLLRNSLIFTFLISHVIHTIACWIRVPRFTRYSIYSLHCKFYYLCSIFNDSEHCLLSPNKPIQFELYTIWHWQYRHYSPILTDFSRGKSVLNNLAEAQSFFMPLTRRCIIESSGGSYGLNVCKISCCEL